MARTPLPPVSLPANLDAAAKRAAIPRLQKRIGELIEFQPSTVMDRSDPRITTIAQAIDTTLSNIFGHGTIEYNKYRYIQRLDTAMTNMLGPTPIHKVIESIEQNKAKAIAVLEGIISGFMEDIEEFPSRSGSIEETSQEEAPLSRKVFLVHGHDEGPRESVARFLEKIGFVPVILHERPNKGRTIITKFQDEAADVGFAVVLMTPDDCGGVIGGPNRQRARQNVVFELGFFIGQLGSGRVAALVKGDIERPSDYDGVVYISVDGSGWKMDLARELEGAGYSINWNSVMRP